MNPNDYIRHKDNHKITGIVVMHLAGGRMEIAGPIPATPGAPSNA
jgi:hypothetical protein